MTRREPTRSTRKPTAGAAMPPTSLRREKANDVAARLQPNSAIRGSKRGLKPQKKGPPVRDTLAAEAKTIHQPKKKPVREATIVPMLTRGDLAGILAPADARR